MLSTKIDHRSGPASKAARRDRDLIARAARRADWAGTMLRNAAGDLKHAQGEDGNALSGLAEVVRDQAARVSNLAKDIESHAPVG